MTDEALRELLASHAGAIRGDFDAAVARFESQSAETRSHFDVTAERMQERFDEAVARFEAQSEETRNHFDLTAERFDIRFDLLAEAIIQLDEKLDRTAERLDEKIDRTAAETQAMIRSLAHRVTALEEWRRSPE